MKKTSQDQKGAALLLMVVVVGASALLMAIGASRLGMGELEMGYISQKADETLYLADGCADEALLRLRKNAGYSGGALSLESGSCMINVAANGNDRTITVGATSGQFNKKIRVNATINGTTIIINSWTEISL